MEKIIHDSIDSTQTDARLRIASTDRPFVVMAHLQTNGYGKFERAWESYSGNFLATFAINLSIQHYDFGKIPMLVCIKLCELLSTLSHSKAEFRVKWPNDIMLNKKKIGGILIEKVDSTFLVGIGLNLRQSPEDGKVSYATTNVLAETGVQIDTIKILDEMSEYFIQFAEVLKECDAAKLRQKYMTLLEGLGQTRKVVTRQETFFGQLHDINNDGALILDVDGDKKLIYSADVFI
ncbi:MAG: biotin--[acetyl-CoA-carboxylase] ligase [Alphaproteobacteria bacterium]|nr:biotin--[acetyl-CoA-carboxylase] ligase [Alphaproteobacteria bacterium]